MESINYIHVCTPEEVEENKREREEWWNKLDDSWKLFFFNLQKDIEHIQQMTERIGISNKEK